MNRFLYFHAAAAECRQKGEQEKQAFSSCKKKMEEICISCTGIKQRGCMGPLELGCNCDPYSYTSARDNLAFFVLLYGTQKITNCWCQIWPYADKVHIKMP